MLAPFIYRVPGNRVTCYSLLSNQAIISLFISYLDGVVLPVSIDVQHCQSLSFKQVVKLVLPFQEYVSRNVWSSLPRGIPCFFGQLSTRTKINLFHYLPIIILCISYCFCQCDVDPGFVKIKCLVSIRSGLFYFVSDNLTPSKNVGTFDDDISLIYALFQKKN